MRPVTDPGRHAAEASALSSQPLGADRHEPVAERPGHVPAEEPGDEGVGRVVPDLGRAPGLGDAAVVHDDHPVGERERLVVVVGHEDDRQPEADEQRSQLGDEPVAQRAVERAERLVEHEEPGRGRERAGERDALLLTARQFGDPAVLEALESDERERLACTRFGFGARPPLHAEPEDHVADDVAMREERVVLEHQAELTAVRRHRREIDAVPSHAPGRLGREPGDRAEEGALAAPARSQHAHDLAFVDRRGRPRRARRPRRSEP